MATDGNRKEAVRQLSGLEREEAEHLLVCLAQYKRRGMRT
jgi:hypothetical protein